MTSNRCVLKENGKENHKEKVEMNNYKTALCGGDQMGSSAILWWLDQENKSESN